MESENFFIEEDEKQSQISIESLQNEFDYDETIKTSPSFLVVRGDKTRYISGVRSCGDNPRHQEAALGCLQDFLKDVIFENRHFRYIDSKIESISARWTNRTLEVEKEVVQVQLQQPV